MRRNLLLDGVFLGRPRSPRLPWDAASARLLVRARLVHDVLRVVFPRVGLGAAPREQRSQPEE